MTMRALLLRKNFKCLQRCATRLLSDVAPQLDYSYLLNPNNEAEILTNIRRRKSRCDLQRLISLQKELDKASPEAKLELEKELQATAFHFPNRAHPDILKLPEDPTVTRTTGHERSFGFKPCTFEVIAKHLNLLRTENLSNFAGPRSYFLLGDLARLEASIVQYSLSRLLKRGFRLLSVPDILDRSVIEGCGMETRGERNQVYTLSEEVHGKDLCLSGTAEMGIGRYLRGRHFTADELPVRLAAVSRCYRAETSKIAEEKGIYRVHQFTKVEMFGVTSPDESESLLNEFRDFQEETFASLGLHLRTLDMPQEELGAQAYRKYDVEAWLPGKRMWAELSSTSDCTDYQSRRLGITTSSGGRSSFLHTVNGTACAVPRLLIALIETHQNQDKTVDLPEALVPLMGASRLSPSSVPKTSMYKAYLDNKN